MYSKRIVVKFEVLIAETVTTMYFWNVTSYSLIDSAYVGLRKTA
jgi:hypothetical protein